MKKRLLILTLGFIFAVIFMVPIKDINAQTTGNSFIRSYSFETNTGVFKADYTKDGRTEYCWCYLVNGKVQYNYTGFAENQNGWWYIVNGKVDFNKNDVMKATVNGDYGWWNVRGGKVQFYDTVAKNSNGWWYCRNGKVDFNFNGFAWNQNGCWYCRGGKVDFNKTDVVKGTVDGVNAWWYVKGGKVQFVNSVEKNSNGWWAIFDGKVDFSFTGVATNRYGNWFIVRGKVDFNKNGVVKDDDGNCYYVKGGKATSGPNVINIDGKWRYVNYYGMLDDSYCGPASNENGLWYINYGVVSFEKTGLRKMSDGNWYNFKDGRLIPNTLAQNSAGLWYIDYNGRVNFNYNGLAYADDEQWYVKGGKVDKSANGLVYVDWYDNYLLFENGKFKRINTVVKFNGSWVYINQGELDPYYTGSGKNENGTWYIKDGKVDFNYNGTYGPNTVKGGKFTTNYTNLYESYYDKYERIFGNKAVVSRGYAAYDSQEEADRNMVDITIKAWDFKNGTSGEKYTRTFTIKVNKAVAPSLQKAFDEIYALPEQFPIHAIGGYDGDYLSGQHGIGLAVDINPNENYEAYYNSDGSIRITCGSLYEPGKNPYSIATDGNVANILAKYGFTQGAWGNKVDYMHFSYFGN